MIHNFSQLNIWCLLVSGGTILLILLFRRISRRFPATLAALVIISGASALLGSMSGACAWWAPSPA